MNILFVSFENDIMQDFITLLSRKYISPLQVVKTLNTDLSSSTMPVLVLDKVSYSGVKLLDLLTMDLEEEEKGEFYAFQALIQSELSLTNHVLDLSEYTMEYPWPLNYILWTRDYFKKNSGTKTRKEKKEIIGIIEKYVQGKDFIEKKLVDYWIYSSVNAIVKCKDEELKSILKGSVGIQDFIQIFK